MADRTFRFPEVERIDPIPTQGTLKVGYVVVAELGKYFNARHRQVVETLLRGRIDPIKRLAITSGQTAGRSRLAVKVEPSDSMGGLGSFVVHDTLKEFFKPRVPHAAILVMHSPNAAYGDFAIGMQVLGNPSTSVVRGLESGILATKGTVAIQRDRSGPRHFVITVRGTWEDVTHRYRERLITSAKISATLF